MRSLPNIFIHKICSIFIKYVMDKITMICATIKLAKSNISINLASFAPDFIPDSNFHRIIVSQMFTWFQIRKYMI